MNAAGRDVCGGNGFCSGAESRPRDDHLAVGGGAAALLTRLRVALKEVRAFDGAGLCVDLDEVERVCGSLNIRVEVREAQDLQLVAHEAAGEGVLDNKTKTPLLVVLAQLRTLPRRADWRRDARRVHAVVGSGGLQTGLSPRPRHALGPNVQIRRRVLWRSCGRRCARELRVELIVGSGELFARHVG